MSCWDDLVSGSDGSTARFANFATLLIFSLGAAGCELDPSQIARIVHHRPPNDKPPAHVDAGCTSPTDVAVARDGAGDGAADGSTAADAHSVQHPCMLVSTPGIPGVCAPSAPFQWSGPGKLMTGDSPDSVPACPAGSQMTFASGTILGIQGPTCQGCTCGAPKDLSCGPASAGDFFWDADCTFPCSTSCLGCGSTCAFKVSSCANHGSLAMNRELRPAALLGGSCVPSSPPAAPPVAFARAGRACLNGPEPPVCGGGETCTSPTGKTCLFHLGDDLQCPRGPYTERSIFYARTDDSRACTSCSCGGPRGVTCPTRIEVFSNGAPATCTGTLTETFETTAPCLGLDRFPNENGGGSLHFVPAQPSGAGSCAPGGTETGALAQGLPFTACCIPDAPL